MNDEMEWEQIRGERTPAYQPTQITALRAALLFGAFAVMLGLFVAPTMDRGNDAETFAQSAPFGIDPIITASTPRPSGQTYTIRRSVLQSTPGSACIIRANGIATGDC